jgi:hypothetical protein
MRNRTALLVVGLLVAATGCGLAQQPGGQACTGIGCVSQVSVVLPDLGLQGAKGVVTAQMCFDGQCDEQRQRFRANGASFGRQGSSVEVSASDNDVTLMLRLPDVEYDETTVHRLTVKVRVDGGKPVTMERDVTLERGQPNGPECEPVCWQARVEA